MTTPAKVTWFEITSNDPTASRTFYETLFGWNAKATPTSTSCSHQQATAASPEG